MIVLIIANNDIGLYNFRLELVEQLLEEGYQVIVSSPYGKRIEDLIDLGCKYEQAVLDRHGTNPIKELKLLRHYYKLIKRTKPNIVLTYTIKPNIYGGIASRMLKLPYLSNITGLGTTFENKGFQKSFSLLLYKIGLKKAQRIFYQNKDNMTYMQDNNIGVNNSHLLPGSGVNTGKFTPIEKTIKDNILRVLFIARITKDKGIEEYLTVAEKITEVYGNIEFQILGPFDNDVYKSLVLNNQHIKYLGISKDVRNEIREVDCIVNPSYHEGMSNVLLEGAAMGKPLIASDIPGCKEIVDDGINGYLFDVKSVESLESAILKFIVLSEEERSKMGIASRKKVVNHFDRQIIVNAYFDEIKKLIG